MRMFKKGFSLAEFLIAIAIISIIAIMSGTIAKQNIERAFNIYIYTGFKGLSDAIAITNSENNIQYINENGVNLSATKTLLETLRKNLGDNRNDIGENDYTIIAPNGIVYELNDKVVCTADSNYCFLPIGFSVPTQRKRVDDNIQKYRTFTLFYYIQPANFNIILPYTGKDADNKIDIINRMDLLAYYIDDGITGRIIPGKDFEARKYYSLREAYCRSKFAEEHSPTNIGVDWDCSDIMPANRITGALRLINPRKI